MFVDATSSFVSQFDAHTDEPDFAYVFEPARLDEAGIAASCVDDYVDSELADLGNPAGVGRTRPVIVPRLGYVLRKKMDRLTEEELECIRWAIYKSIAIGYFSQIQAECPAVIRWEGLVPEVRTDRTSDKMWSSWTKSIYGADAAFGLRGESYGQLVDRARRLGGDILYDGLHGINLVPRFRKSSKFFQIGYWYATAGVSLRYLQSTLVSDIEFTQQVEAAN